MAARSKPKKLKGRPKREGNELVRATRVHLRRLLALPNVTSAGIGYKIKDAKRTPDLAIQVTVSRKLLPEQLERLGIAALPKKITLPDGRKVPVDVVQRTFKLAYQLVVGPAAPALANNAGVSPAVLRRRRLDRVVPGVSVSHIDGKAGTIAAVVYDRRTGRPCILSNAHVLTDFSDAVGAAIVQPGRFDDGDVLANGIGVLLRSHVGLAGDCAIASIDARPFNGTILEIGVEPRRIAEVAVGDAVVKSGRTTGVTRGVVTRLGVVTSHDYGGTVGTRQINGFEIGPDPAAPPKDDLVADEGDSGSLWLIHDGGGGATDIAAGLHFAVEEDPQDGPSHVLANPIRTVLERLDVSLLPPT